MCLKRNKQNKKKCIMMKISDEKKINKPRKNKKYSLAWMSVNRSNCDGDRDRRQLDDSVGEAIVTANDCAQYSSGPARRTPINVGNAFTLSFRWAWPCARARASILRKIGDEKMFETRFLATSDFCEPSRQCFSPLFSIVFFYTDLHKTRKQHCHRGEFFVCCVQRGC